MSVVTDPGFRPKYHELHRVGRSGIWRSVVGSLLLIVLVFAVVPLIAGGIAVVALMASGSSAAEAARALDLTEEVTPTALAVVNIVLASAIPLAWLVSWVMHGLKPRWLASIAPRIRWKYLFACLGLSVVALIASLIVAVLLPTAPGGEPVGELNEFTRRTRDFLIVILLLTPFQAAGEEYLFRGYLTQAFGSLVRARQAAQVLAVVGPALIFALFHGFSQAPPVFFDRFAFGVVAGHPRDPHRRARGGHRDARPQQLHGLRARARVRRLHRGGQRDGREQLVDDLLHADPVAGLPGPRAVGGEGHGPVDHRTPRRWRAATPFAGPRFGGVPSARVTFVVGSGKGRVVVRTFAQRSY